MKKIIRPQSPLMVVMYVIITAMLAFVIGGVVVLFCGWHEIDGWWRYAVLAAAIMSFALLVGQLVVIIFKKITLEDKSINVEKDMSLKFFPVLQHAVKVDYRDISDIYLTVSTQDSHKKAVAHVIMPMPYIVLQSKTGKKRINVYYYTKKQVVEMIDEIIARAKEQGNILDCGPGEKIFAALKEKNVDSYRLRRKPVISHKSPP